MSRKGSSQTESLPTATSLQKRESNVSESSAIITNTQLTNTYQTTDVSTAAIMNRNFGIRKRVNFKLNNVQEDIVEEQVEEEEQELKIQQQQVAVRKVYRKKTKKKRCGTESNAIRKYNSLDRRLNLKNIVFNGTFPIDYPLKSRFDARHSSSSGLDYSDEYEAIENCDHEYVEDEVGDQERRGESRALHSMSMQELVEDKKFNIAKMKKEFQVSLAEFEKFLAKGGPTHNKNVRTYSIDEPL